MPALHGNSRRAAIFLKLQSLQNKVTRTNGNLPRRTPTRDLHMAFKIPYLYDYGTKLCRQQATVTLNHENVKIRNIGQGMTQHRKYKRLKLCGGQAYDRSIVYTVVISLGNEQSAGLRR
jgi:hypothetical protein